MASPTGTSFTQSIMRSRSKTLEKIRTGGYGPDAAGNLLEVVVMITVEGTQLAIRAMPMRDKYARLLRP